MNIIFHILEESTNKFIIIRIGPPRLKPLELTMEAVHIVHGLLYWLAESLLCSRNRKHSHELLCAYCYAIGICNIPYGIRKLPNMLKYKIRGFLSFPSQ